MTLLILSSPKILEVFEKTLPKNGEFNLLLKTETQRETISQSRRCTWVKQLFFCTTKNSR